MLFCVVIKNVYLKLSKEKIEKHTMNKVEYYLYFYKTASFDFNFIYSKILSLITDLNMFRIKLNYGSYIKI